MELNPTQDIEDEALALVNEQGFDVEDIVVAILDDKVWFRRGWCYSEWEYFAEEFRDSDILPKKMARVISFWKVDGVWLCKAICGWVASDYNRGIR